jgi:cysteine desulfurase
MEVYLDNNATTRPTTGVIEACLAALRDLSANPSSPHAPGVAARRQVERVRQEVAEFLGAASPSEIVFTSGATESIGLAVNCALADSDHGLATSAVEHAAMLHCARSREKLGCKVAVIGVDKHGFLRLEELEEALSWQPRLVSVLLANNETGVLFDISAIAHLCRKGASFIHIDAAQAIGRTRVDVEALGCDYLSFSAHKFHGPKGVGVLYVRSGAPRLPMLPGHQESGLRAGTENVVGILGLGAAIAELESWEQRCQKIQSLRDRLESDILSAVSEAQVNGGRDSRVCNTTSIYFPFRNAADLVERLSRKGVYVSASAACTTGGEPSHVLQAMGFGRERANASLRFSLSRLTTAAEVKAACQAVADVFAEAPPVFTIS